MMKSAQLLPISFEKKQHLARALQHFTRKWTSSPSQSLCMLDCTSEKNMPSQPFPVGVTFLGKILVAPDRVVPLVSTLAAEMMR